MHEGRRGLLGILIVLLLLSSYVQAVPVTRTAMLVGNNNVTLSATGVTTIGWFNWGMGSGKLYLKTTNQTPQGGIINYTVKDYPLYGNTNYYYRVCDPTGCGSELSFITPAVTPLPLTTLGSAFDNMTETHFDPQFIPQNAINPYTWVLPQTPAGIAIAILTGLFFSAIFIGMWWHGGGTVVPAGVGILFLLLIFGAGFGAGITIPPEISALGQGAAYACFAGILLGFFKR